MDLVTSELPEPQKSHELPESYVHPLHQKGKFLMREIIAPAVGRAGVCKDGYQGC